MREENDGNTTNEGYREYTVEELGKELAEVVVASSKIDDLTTAIKAAKQGRLTPYSVTGIKTPYGYIADDIRSVRK